MCNFKSRYKRRLFYYIGMQSSVSADMGDNTEAVAYCGQHHTLFPLTCYSSIFWFFCGCVMLEGQDLGMQMLELQLYSADRDPCSCMTTWLAARPAPLPWLSPQVIRSAPITQPELWYLTWWVWHSCVTETLSLTVPDRYWSGLLSVN